MNLRVLFNWLVVVGLVTGNVTWAQGVGPYGPASGATPTAYSPAPSPPGPPPGYAPNACPPGFVGEDVYAQLLPEDRGFGYQPDSRLHLSLNEALEGSWIRLEYLIGNLHRDGGTTLGRPLDAANPALPSGPTIDVRDPSKPFNVLFSDGETTALAQVPTTDHIGWENAQGIRGSFGIPIVDDWWIEARFWHLGELGDTLNVPSLPIYVNPELGVPTDGTLGAEPVPYLATTLTTDGQPGTRLILYDSSFSGYYRADLWSSDVNFVYNWITPDLGFRFQPMFGYRHEEYGEQLTFGGSFENRTTAIDSTDTAVGYITDQTTIDPISNNFDSRTRNFRDQVQVGLRQEWAHQWLTLGAQEKLAFGSNIIRTELLVENVREPGNPTLDDPARTVTRDRNIGFAPTFDLDLYADIHLRKWLKLRAGWSLVWMGGLGVADQSIRFNEVTTDPDTGATAADVVTQIGEAQRVMSVFTIGGEIILP